MSEVFDSAFLRRLERLTLRIQRVLRASGRGDRKSRRKGESPEFSDHRAYRPGDDIRRIDWGAYARLGELYLKRHAAEQDLTVHILLDASASMRAAPGKWAAACRLAAALAYVGMASGDRIALSALAGGRVVRSRGPWRGRRNFRSLLEAIDGLEPGGETSLSKAVEDFCKRRASSGLVLLISDLFDEDYERGLKHLRYTRFEPCVLQVLSREEREPELAGERELTCVESGAALSMTLDRTALGLYRQSFESFLDAVRRFCQQHEIAYVSAMSDAPLEQLLFEDLRDAGFF